MAQQHRNLIGGEWVAGAEAQPNVNPSDTCDVIGDYAQADAGQTRAAVAAAAQAARGWARSTPQQRCDVLDRIGSEILAREEELGRLLSREEGKPLAEGRAEALRAGQIFKFFAGEAVRTPGEAIASIRPGVQVEISREPLGVVGIVAPWNFPLAIPAWKIAPALAYGNAVVFKPAELVPASAWALAEVIARSGMPAGVFNLVMGPGRVVGDAIVESPEVAAISFTGSTGTGRAIAAKALARGARVQVEMGGKNPLVVVDDADLDIAADVALNGAFFSTGQRCTASSRLIVTEGIHDRFVAALLERLRHFRVGHALEPDTKMGPVVDERQLGIDLGYVGSARRDGAALAFGGGRLERPTPGWYMAPALFTGTHGGMAINQEEVFGPVACVIPVRDYDEALQVANGVPHGLSAGICTTSLKLATHFKRHADAGMVMVNLPTAGVDYHAPFGGRKASSWGPREQGRAAVEFYTQGKTAYTLS